MSDKLFNELLESVKEMDAIAAGKKKPSKVTEYPEPVVSSIRKIDRGQSKNLSLISNIEQ